MATWDRYKTQETSFEVRVRKGLVFQPRFYCDDDSFAAVADSLKPYFRKAPVCKLTVTPTVQFINTNLTWDISNSISASSTINTFDIFFNGSPTDLTGQSWASASKTGTIQYNAVGEYVIEAYVTDILGVRSQTQSVMVEIIEDYPEPAAVFIATTNSGVYKLLPDGNDPAQVNTGLNGNHLNIRALAMHPAYKNLPNAQKHIWLATQDGVAYSVDGATTWLTISKDDLGDPVNTAGDGTPPVTADLDQRDIALDPADVNRVYVLRTTATRAWLYYTDDYGASWSNVQVSDG